MNIRLSAARKTIIALLATFCVLFLTLGVVSLNSNSSQTLSASAETTAYTPVSDADGLSTAVATDGNYQLTADITGITSSVTIASGNTITLDLNGHTLSASAVNTVTVENGGSLTVLDSVGGGTIANVGGSSYYAISNSGDFNIESGTITAVRAIFQDAGTFTMTGGTISSTDETITSSGFLFCMYIKGGTADISGGYLSCYSSGTNNAYVIYDLATVTLSGDTQVISSAADNTAQIAGVYMSQADQNSLTINDNVTIKSSFVTSTATGNSAKNSNGICVYGCNDSEKVTTLVINGGSVYGDTYGICGNGSQHYTSVTINDGDIEGGCIGFYHPQNGDLTVTGGSITGLETAIEIRSGSLTITGGTFIATSTTFKAASNSNGTTVVGAAIAVSQHTTNNDISVSITGGTFSGYYAVYETQLEASGKTNIAVDISGGTYTSTAASNQAAVYSSSTRTDSTSALSITGGTYNTDVSAYAASGLTATDDDNGTYSIALSNASKTTYSDKNYLVVTTSGVTGGYTSFSDALTAAVSAGSTAAIWLNGNSTLDSAITISDGQTVTLNLNGHTLKFADDTSYSEIDSLSYVSGSSSYNFYAGIVNNGTLTITDTVGTGSVTIETAGKKTTSPTVYSYYIIVYNNGTFELDSGSLISSGANTTTMQGYGIYNGNVATISGGYVEVNEKSGYGIYSTGMLSVTGGEIKAKATSSYSTAIYLTSSSEVALSISGVTLSAYGKGLYIASSNITVTIEDSSITSTQYGIYNIGGNVTIKNTTVTAGSTDTSSYIYVMYNNNKGIVTVESGTFTTVSKSGSAGYGFYNLNGSTLIINGGTINTGSYAVRGQSDTTNGNCKVYINGGTISSQNYEIYCYSYSDIIVTKVDNSTPSDVSLYLSIYSYDMTSNESNSTVTVNNSLGVVISGATEEAVTSGLVIISETSTEVADATKYYLGVTSESAYAYIENSEGIKTYYANPFDALSAANDGETVVLFKEYSRNAGTANITGKSVTLDLNGYSITNRSNANIIVVSTNGTLNIINSSSTESIIKCTNTSTSNAAFQVEPGGTMTVGENVVLTSSMLVTMMVGEYNNTYTTTATLNVYGSILNTRSAGGYAIAGNGMDVTGGTKINIYDGAAVTSEYATGIFHPQVGTLTIYGGTITGAATAIEMRSGSLVIYDGTFAATTDSFSATGNGSGTTVVGAAIAISQHTTNNDLSVSISGGTFSGVYAVYEEDLQDGVTGNISIALTGGTYTSTAYSDAVAVKSKNVENFISGGSYNTTVEEDYLATGLAVSGSANSEGYYTLTLSNTSNVAALYIDGEKKAEFSSLSDLFTNLNNGYYDSNDQENTKITSAVEVRLYANITDCESITNSCAYAVTLNLNGNNITFASGATLTNSGTLTITGNGSSTLTFVSDKAITNSANSTLTIESGVTITSTYSESGAHYLIINNGTLYVTGGTISSSLRTISNKGTMYVSGGTISGGFAAIENVAGYTLYVSGGTIKSTSSSAIYNSGSVEISGGTVGYSGRTAVYANGGSSATISAGFIIGKFEVIGTGKIELTGGYFTDTTAGLYVAEGYAIDSEASTTYSDYYQVMAEDNFAATINGVGYKTLAAAIAAADGKTVVVVQDITITSAISITSGSVTLDLNGKTVTGNVSIALRVDDSSATLTIMDSFGGGKLTANNVAIRNVGNLIIEGGYIYAGDRAIQSSGDSSITVNGGTLEGGIYGIVCYAGSVTVNNGTISGGTYGILNDNTDSLSGDATTIINGGTISGSNRAVQQAKGTITITGGTLIAESTDSTAVGLWTGSGVIVNISGGTITATASGDNESFGLYIKGSTATISGNTSVTAKGSNAYAIEMNTGANVTINGGTFTSDYRGIFVKGDSASNYSYLYINGGTITASSFAVVTYGSKEAYYDEEKTQIYYPGYVKIYISGGEITSTGMIAMYLPGYYGETYISGGTIKGTTGIEIRMGKIEISGGTIIATSSELITNPNDNGATVTGGAALAISAYNLADLSVKISDGTFEGLYAVYENYVNGEGQSLSDVGSQYTLSTTISEGTFKGIINAQNVTGFISGGSYNSTTAAAYVDSNYLLNGSVNDEGYYTLIDNNTTPGGTSNVVATITTDNGTVGFTSLQEAIDAAAENATITLTSSIDVGTVTIYADDNITLNLGSNTLTATIYNHGTLAIEDGTLSGTIYNYATLNLKGAKVEYTDPTAGASLFSIMLLANTNTEYNAIVNYGGTVTIADGTEITGETYGIKSYNGEVIIKDGTVTGGTYALYLSGTTLTIEGGTLSGDVYLGACTGTISGGTFSDAVTIDGGSIAISDSASFTGALTAGGSTAISGGTFSSTVTLSDTASISGGTFTGNVAISSGSISITGGTFNNAIENNGTITIADNTVTGSITNNGTLYITSGTLSSTITSSGTLYVSDGTVSGNVTVSGGVVNISGGTLSGDFNVNGGVVSVTGGTFKTDVTSYVATGYALLINDNGTYTAVVASNLTSGKYTTDVSAYIANGYVVLVNSDGTYTVAESSSTSVVATIGTMGFATLQEAFDYAETSKTDVTIKLSSDILASATLGETLATVTLDLNGKTLSYSGTVITVSSGATLVIEGSTGTIKNTISSGFAVLNNGTLTINGGNISGNYGISNNGTLTVSGGAISGTTYGIYNHNTAVLTISGGTISGTTGSVNSIGGTVTIGGNATLNNAVVFSGTTLVLRTANYNGGLTITDGLADIEAGTYSGEVVISGGTVNINGGTFRNQSGDSVTISGGAVAISGGTFQAGLTISGGNVTISSFATTPNGQLTVTAGAVVISGGEYHNDVSAYVATDYILVMADGATSYKVVALTEATSKGVVAVVGNVGYSSLATAISATPSGGTVTLINTVTESVTISSGSNVILDLNGKTLTNGSANVVTVESGATLTIIDNVTEGTIKSTSTDYNAIQNDGTLYVYSGIIIGRNGIRSTSGTVTVYDGTITGTYWHGIYNEGTLYVHGGTITSGDYGNGISNNGGTATIYDGTITGTYYNGIYNAGALTVENGTIVGYGNGIYNETSTASVTLIGGTVTGTDENGIYNEGTIVISGGTITGNTSDHGIGIYSFGGTATISGATISAERGIVAENGATVTVNNGTTITADIGIDVFGCSATTSGDQNYTTLTVNGGTINGTSYGIKGNKEENSNNDYRYTKIYINGGTISASNGTGIYHPEQYGELYITGGSITGLTGVEIRGGIVKIDGDVTITATGSFSNALSNVYGSTTTGVAVAIVPYVNDYSHNLDITIASGTFSGYYAIYENNVDNVTLPTIDLDVSDGTYTGLVSSSDIAGFISGGSYSSTTAAGYVVSGSALDGAATEGYYGVSVATSYVATLTTASGEVYGYSTLQAAIDAATNGSTIVLNSAVSENITINVSITLDLGGNILTNVGESDTITISNGAVVTIEGDGFVYNTNTDAYSAIKVNGGTLTILGGTINGAMRAINVLGGSTVNIGVSGDNNAVKIISNERGIQIDEASTVNFYSGTIDSNEYGIIVYSTGENYSTLNVYGGEITSVGDFAIGNNGTHSGTEIYDYAYINIYGGTITSTGATAIYLPAGYGVTVITGGTITGYDSGIEIRKGTLTIGEVNGNDSDIVITATAATTAQGATPSGGGATVSGAAFAIAAYNNASINVNVCNGTFVGTTAVFEDFNSADISATVVLSITGGTYTGEIHAEHVTGFISGGVYSSTSAAAYVASGSALNSTASDGYYGVVEVTSYVATVNGLAYSTLAEAFASITSTSTEYTVILLDDCTLTSTITIESGCTVTLDLNGKKLTVESDAYSLFYSKVGSTGVYTYNYYSGIINRGTLTITGNGTITSSATGSLSNKVYTYQNLVYNEGTLTAEEITITGSGGKYVYGIYSSGTLYVNDCSISITSSTSHAIYNYYGTATVSGSSTTISSAYRTIYNYGTMYITGGSITTTSASNAPVTNNSGTMYISGNAIISAIDNSKKNNEFYAVYNMAGSENAVSKLYISGGTFTGSTAGYSIYCDDEYSEVYITGGTFNKVTNNTGSVGFNGKSVTSTLTILNSLNLSVVAINEGSGYELVTSDATLNSSNDATCYVVYMTANSAYVYNSTTGTYYDSLRAALNAANDGDVLVLQKDCTTANASGSVNGSFNISTNVTIDLNGNNITAGIVLFYVKDGGNLTLINSLTGDENTSYVSKTGSDNWAIEIEPGGEVTIGENVVVTSSSGTTIYVGEHAGTVGDNSSEVASLYVYGSVTNTNADDGIAITGNGFDLDGGTVINIYEGAVVSSETSLAIYHPQNGTLTVYGGTITGVDSAIEMRGGTLVIYDGTFTATATTFSENSNSSGTTITGAAIAISQHGTDAAISVTIEGGTFNGYYAVYEKDLEGGSTSDISVTITGGEFNSTSADGAAVKAEDVTEFISGGTYSDESAMTYLATDSNTVVTNGTTFTVYENLTAAIEEGNAVAKIGDLGYTTLAEALAAANDGDIITLLNNVEASVTVSVSGGITLDLAGYSITSDGTAITVNSGELTIINGTVESTATSGQAIYVSAGASLTVSTSANIVSAYNGIQNYGTLLVLDGATITGANNGINNGEKNNTTDVAKLTVNGGTITGTSNTGIRNYNGEVTVNGGSINGNWAATIFGQNSAKYATLTINGGTFTGVEAAISSNGTNGTGTACLGYVIVTINGGTFTAEDTALYLPAVYGVTTISGTAASPVVIEGASGIEIRAGELTISSDYVTVTATGAFSVAANKNGSTVTGAAVAVSQHTTNMDITVEISGGTYIGAFAIYEVDVQDDTTTGLAVSLTNGIYSGEIYSENLTEGFIEGGVYSDTSAAAYVVDGFALNGTAEGGYYGIVATESDDPNVETVVATITTNGVTLSYTSLAAAIAAVPADGTETTIKVVATVNEENAIIIAEGQNIVLDLNGNIVTVNGFTTTPTGASAHVLSYGTLTITDSEDNGELIFGSVRGVYNYGTFILEGGTITGANGQNVLYNTSTGSYSGIMYIEGGAVSSTGYAVLNWTTLYISDGTLYGGDVAVQNSNSTAITTITGGTLGTDGTNVSNYGITNYSGTVKVTDGTISGTSRGIYSNGDLVITGGTVSSEGYAIYAYGGTANISGGNITASGDTSDWTFALVAGEQTEVTISGSAELTAQNETGSAAGIYYYANSDKSTPTKVTITGGTITGKSFGISGNGLESNYSEVVISGGYIYGGELGYFHPEDGKLTISGGTIEGVYGGLQVCAGTVEITGGKFIATASKTDLEGYADSIYNKTGSGNVGDGAAVSIIDRDGYKTTPQLTISGGTFISDTTVETIQAYSNKDGNTYTDTWDEAGDSVEISGGYYSVAPADSTYYADGLVPTAVTINGTNYYTVVTGTFVTAPAEDATTFIYNGSEQTYTLAENSDAYTISGNVQTEAGTYTVTVTLNDGYMWADDFSTKARTYTFTIKAAVAVIGTTGYETLQEAINAATSGDTVTLVANVNESVTVSVSGGITLNLAGYSITSNGTAITVNSGAELYITGNGTISGVYAISNSGIVIIESGTISSTTWLYNYGTLTLNGGTITSGEDGVENYGTLVVNQGTITGGVLGIYTSGTNSSVTIGSKDNANDQIYISGGATRTYGYESALYIDNGATAKVYSGTLEGYYGIAVYGYSNTAYSNLYVYGGEITAAAFAITGNGTGGYGYDNIYIYGGTITSTDAAAIYNPQQEGTTYIMGGTITGLTGVEVRGGEVYIGEDYNADTEEWYYAYAEELTITATGNPLTTESNYSGSTISGAAIAIATYNLSAITVEVGEGTYSSASGYAVYEANVNNYTSLTKTIDVELKNGTFEGIIYSETAENSVTTFVISGGVYSDTSAAAYVASGSALDGVANEEGYYGIVEAATVVAKIGDVSYSTLAEAIAAANNGDEIILLTSTTESITITSGKNIILDLAGYKLTDSGDHTITVNSGATLTIIDSDGNGVVDSTTHQKAAIANFGTVYIYGGTYTRSAEAGYRTDSAVSNGNNSWYTIYNQGTMVIGSETDDTLNNVTVTTHMDSATGVGAYSSLIINGDYTDSTASLTINGGEFIGGLNTVKNGENGDLTINGGEFSNTYQNVIMNWNIAEINGGVFTVSGASNSVVWVGYDSAIAVGNLTINGGVFTNEDDGYVVRAGSTSKGNAQSVVINDGTFNGSINLDSAITAEIYGGTYSDTSAAAYVVEGSALTANGDGTYGIQDVAASATIVATIGNIGYSTLAEAIEAVADNVETTITLNANADLSGTTIADTKNIILDLNGNSITISGGVTISGTNKANICNNGTLTITDSIGGGSISMSGAIYGIYNAGTLTVDGDITISNAYNNRVIHNIGEATISNGTISGYAGVYSTGTLTVEGGSIVASSSYGIYVNGGVTTISGGTIYGAEYAIKAGSSSKFTVTGGIIGKSEDGDISEYGVWSTATSKQAIAISGGEIYATIMGVYTTGTATISNATITTTGSGTETGGYNGGEWVYGVYVNTNNGILTINDGTVITATNGNYSSAGIGYQGGNVSGSSVTVTVNGGSISGDTYGLAGNGSYPYSTVTISGGSIYGGEVGYYHPEDGSLTISGGTIEGVYGGLQICAGDVTISNGTITATATANDISTSDSNKENKSGDGAIVDGAAISIINRGYSATEPTLTISGGTFTSADGIEALQAYSFDETLKATDWNEAGDSVEISGGIYSLLIVDSGYYADGIVPTAITVNGTTYYTVTSGNFVTAPEADTNTYYYTGDDITYALETNAAYTISGNVQKNVGTYTVTVTLNSGYMWDDFTTDSKTYIFVINSNSVDTPTIDSEYTSTGTNSYEVEYNGSTFTFVNAGTGYTVYTGTGTNAGTYTVTVVLDNGYTWSDGSSDSITYTFEITKVEVTAPEEDSKTFYYNGNEQTYTLDSGAYTISGNKQTNAGTYTVTVTLNDVTNYVWADGTTEAKTYEWIINAKEITIPTAGTSSYTYDGTVKEFTLESNVAYTISGTTSATNAGTYTVTVTLNDVTNYVWSNGTTDVQTYVWVINTDTVAAPSASISDYTYDGTVKEFTLASSVAYTVSGTTSATNAGTYTVTVTLNAGYTWTDGSTNTLTFEWTIEKATYNMADVSFSNTTVTYDGKEYSITITGTLPEDVSVSYVGSGINAGEYTITAIFTGDSDNYEAITNLTAILTIAKATNVLTGEVSISDWAYGSAANAPAGVISANGGTVVYLYSTEKDGDYTTTVPTAVGTYWVKAYVAESTNYNEAYSEAVSFEITKAVNSVSVNIVGWTYGDDINEAITHATYGTAEVTFYSDEDCTIVVDITTAGAGTYYVKAVVAESDTYTSASATASFTIAQAKVSAPNADTTTYIYTGSEITYKLAESDYYTVKGATQTDVGTYEVTVALINANYTWTDGSTDELTYTFVISAATMNVTSEDYSGDYDGEAHTGSVTVDALINDATATIKYVTESGTYDLTEAPKYTEVGTYVVYYEVSAENYNTVYGSYTVTINEVVPVVEPTKVEAPEADTTTYTYTGSELNYIIAENEAYTVSGATQTEAGSYIVTVTLTDTEKYTWADGSTAALTYVFVINNATMNVSASGYSGDYDSEEHTGSITVDTLINDATATIKYGTESGTYDLTEAPEYSEVGTYVVYYEVSAENYNTVYGSYTVTINEVVEEPTLDTVVTSSNSTVSGSITSEDGFAMDVTIEMNHVDAGEYGASAETIIEAVTQLENAEIVSAYDVSLTSDGKEVTVAEATNGGKVTVSVAIPTSLVGQEFYIVHIHNGEVIDVLTSSDYTIENGNVIFEVDDLSQFVFVAAAASDSGLSEHQIAQASVLVGGTAAIMVVLALAAFTIVKTVSGKKRRRA